MTHAAGIAQPASPRTIARADAAVDCAFLAAVTVVSLLPYVRGLGFYYDDYSVLARMSGVHNGSLVDLYHAVRPLTGQRPLQALTFAVLYRIFGLHPLGYHISNACLLVAVAALLYLVLRELRLPRLVCIALPLVYSTLPHYATNRFWLDAFQINLSSAFYLLSLYAGLRALRAGRAGVAVWLPVAVLSIAGSLLAYEIVYPLFAVNIGMMWWADRRLREEGDEAGTARITIGVLAVAVVAVGLAKAALVAQHGQNGYQIGFGAGFAHHVAYLVSGGIKLNLGTYLLAIPYVLWWIVRHQLTAANAAAAGASGLLALAYLWHIGRRDRDVLTPSALWLTLVRVGLLVFVLGYAVFLTNQNVLFRSAGIDNRVNAGAALGLAGIGVGALGWLTARLNRRRRAAVFSVALACTVATGVLIVDTLGSFWTNAAQRQRALVTGVQQVAAPLPASSSVILDGVCPEMGPAVVFADQWDFRGALQLAYHDRSISADVAAEGLRARPRALALEMSFLNRSFARTYPYGRDLLVYDAPRSRLYHLRNRGDAARYLARSRPSFRCAPQRSFAWGFDLSSRLSLP
jgi:hypothetical protein